MNRALWHPLEVVVVDIDDSIPADHRAWLRGRLGVTPRKGGVTFREGASQGAVINSWQLRQLRSEAARAGDSAQVEICDQALAGDSEAREECERVISAAIAMMEPEARG